MSVPAQFRQSTPSSDQPVAPTGDPVAAGRAEARTRLEARRKIVTDVVSYVVINAFLVFVWLITGAGYFWPVWVLAGWGIFLVLHVWEVLWRRPITEADIDEELRRNR